MREVNLDTQIQEAANDYFRTNLAITYLIENAPYSIEDLEHYQENVILSDLRYIKEELGLELESSSSSLLSIQQSKKCYYKAMGLPVREISNITSNNTSFQRGTIHLIVNETNNKFCWKYPSAQS